MKKFNQAGLAPLVLLLIVAALGIVAFVGFRQLTNKPTSSVTKQEVKPTQKPRSQAPGIIIKATTTKAIDPKTGEATAPNKYFAPLDKALFLVSNLNNSPSGTRIEYVRYLNGKYLDHGSVKLVKPDLKNVGFNFSPKKTGAKHKKGIYRVRLYTNGILEKKVNYIVRSQ